MGSPMGHSPPSNPKRRNAGSQHAGSRQVHGANPHKGGWTARAQAGRGDPLGGEGLFLIPLTLEPLIPDPPIA